MTSQEDGEEADYTEYRGRGTLYRGIGEEAHYTDIGEEADYRKV